MSTSINQDISNAPDPARLIEVLERAPTAFMAFDHDWRILYMNEAGGRLVQRHVPDLIGRTMDDVFPELVGSAFDLAYRRAAATNALVLAEDYFAPLDRWMEVAAYPIRLGLAVHFADVSARRGQTEQLARRERELSRAQQIASVGSWSWHIGDNTVQWSDETYRILGFDAEFRPAIAQMQEFIHHDDVPRNWDAIRATIDHDAPYDIVLRMRRADGAECVCHARAEVARDEAGVALELIGSLQDITARRQLEREAQQDKLDLEIALRAAKMANYTWDARSPNITWSAGYFELLGLDPSTFVPLREAIFSLIHPDDVDMVRRESATALANGSGFDFRYRIQHADGSWRHIESVARIERDGDGGVERVVGSVRDRTDEVRVDEERIRLERQLQQAQKLESLGVLAGGIAHDFNNLLVGILGNTSLAMTEVPQTGMLPSLLGEVERAGQRAAELTRQLLAYAGKGRFVVEPINLTSLVEEMLTLLRSAISRKATLHLDLARELPAINGDATQVRQIVMNLLTNASDALEDRPGTLSLRTGVQLVDATYRETLPGDAQLEDGRYVFLEVADTGVGMNAQTIERIFDPFFTTKFTGRGLGLAATRGIVQGHRGSIKVYSEPTKGSTFKLLFPAVDAPTTTRVAPPPDATWRGHGTVLVIDDEVSVRRVVRVVLERLGFNVLDAADGVEGLAVYQRQHAQIRLIFLDLTMPRLDGEETFRQLRMLNDDVRVVLMSGYNSQNVTSQFVGKGLAGFLQKPFRAEALESELRSVLGG